MKPGNIYARFPSPDAALQGRPVMLSAIRGGEIVQQQETVLDNTQAFYALPPGLYDVRAEGQGAVTEVKRGVHVFAGQDLGGGRVVTTRSWRRRSPSARGFPLKSRRPD